MKRSDLPVFSRVAGAPLFGKRTARLKFSVAPLTKELAQIEAQKLGLSVAEFVHIVVVQRVHGADQVRHVALERLDRVAGKGDK